MSEDLNEGAFDLVLVGAISKDENIYRAPLTPRTLNGRTGRGDTLFCSYLARRTQGDGPFKALQFAAALVSLKLEAPGPFRGTLEDVMLKMNAQEL